MLQITIPETELFDEARQEFIYVNKPVTLTLEHSLVSISKWEAKWKKPYLDDSEKTAEEVIDYIRCMTITQNVDPQVYYALTMDNFKEIEEYIKDPHTATTIKENTTSKRNREGVTSELVYYWMCAYQIPFEAQKWHFNRLMTLIRIAGIKNNAESNKMSKDAALKQQRELNARRRAKYKTRG
jgi:hypothetical protein